MLSWLIPRLHFGGAIALVALFAVCAVMPPVALAFPHGNTSSHCLTRDHHGVTDVRFQDGIGIHVSFHTPGDSAIDELAGNSKEDGDGKLKCHVGACCGFSCFAAINSDSAATLAWPVHASPLFKRVDESLDGCGSERISRPPKFFLSL